MSVSKSQAVDEELLEVYVKNLFSLIGNPFVSKLVEEYTFGRDGSKHSKVESFGVTAFKSGLHLKASQIKIFKDSYSASSRSPFPESLILDFPSNPVVTGLTKVAVNGMLTVVAVTFAFLKLVPSFKKTFKD